MNKTYDFKVIEFPNGTYEFRIYDSPISELSEEEKGKRQRKRERSIERRKGEMCAPSEFVYIPFEDNVVEVVDVDKQAYFEFADEKRKQKNARDSYRRTLNKIHDLARCENWNMFYTLTFSSEYVDRQDFGACMKKARKWIDNIKQRKSPDLKYLLIPELHSDGESWHIHGLVCEDDGVAYVDSGLKDDDGRTIYNVEKYNLGWSTATKIDDTHKISSYVLKYITKDLCERSLGQRRYYRSNNLQEPKVSTYLSSQIFNSGYVYDVNNLEKVFDSLGLEEVTRIKKVVSEYCSVTYINAI